MNQPSSNTTNQPTRIIEKEVRQPHDDDAVMAAKRGPSPELIPNPFIKKRNLEWAIELPGDEKKADWDEYYNANHEDRLATAEEPERAAIIHGDSRPATATATAAVEAGEARVDDHLERFSRTLAEATLAPFPPGAPRLPVSRYRALYAASSGSARGAHFVVHQHDHPVAGTHYDLRLQINETSSASWALMYGLPGDPNSKRLNRNATETRVHCLWNHLIETASMATGSLLIWDTGTYTVLPSKDTDDGKAPAADPDSQESASPSPPPPSSAAANPKPGPTEQEKLHRAFQARKIRVQLHGSRLPPNYVLNLRLTRDEDAAGRARSLREPTKPRRRRRGGGGAQQQTSSSDDEDGDQEDADDVVTAPASEEGEEGGGGSISAMEREIRELEDDQVRRTNAYPGAANTAGSVHQRRWYLSLDREACGFARRHRRGGGIVWEPNDDAMALLQQPLRRDNDGDGAHTGEEEVVGDKSKKLSFPFYVRGVEAERSVVTGRRGADVLRDEGVVGYVSRKGWRPVLN
ncbi:hypothetical protein SLS62_008716 [Diatrype stigma]|uniref:DNA ligase D 3'-phosphoesterase domain-containing protein n=1 Tax=Diatrype stigma TaxID=117547 RepID=A0AAN9UIZ2_9PEZI